MSALSKQQERFKPILVTAALLFGLLTPCAVYATNSVDQPEQSSQVEEPAEDVSGGGTSQEIPDGSVSSDEESSPDADGAKGSQNSADNPDLANKQDAPADSVEPQSSSAEVLPVSIDRYGRTVVNINEGWSFTSNDVSSDGWGFPDGRSSGMVNLPHSWEYVHPTRSYIPFFNKKTATYSKTIDVSEFQNASLTIRFYGVSKNTELLVDGVKVGTHVGGYSAFAFDLTDYIQGKDAVTLTVNVTNVDTDSIPVNVDYTQWAGIYRDVELIATPASHFSLSNFGTDGLFVDYSLKGGNASVCVRTDLTLAQDLDNDLLLRTTLFDANGKAVVQDEHDVTPNSDPTSQEISQSLLASGVHLWNGISDPYLYTVKAELIDSASGQTLDEVACQVGFRTFEVKNGKAYLNGNVIQIHGVGYHQDREGYGNAVSAAQIASDIDQMLEMGVNFIRASHYPHDRAFYDLCNKKGILVYNEIPYYMIYSKAESYSSSITEQLKEMIRQSYNYPCVVMDGIQNEVVYNSQFAQYGADFDISLSQLVAFNSQLVDLAHKEDPNRMVVQATIDGMGHAANTKKWSSGIDLTGLNLYVGFKSAVSSAGDSGRKALEAELNQKLDSYKNIYGVNQLMISEYGAGANINHHIEVDDSFSWNGDSDSKSSQHYEEYQSFIHEAYWDMIQHRSDIPVTSVWNMFDFSCYRNEGGTTRLNTKGLMCYDHVTRKDAYYFYKANWNTNDPFVYLTSKRYTSRQRQTQDVKVYSNCDSVTLYLNGVSLGTGAKQQSGVFVWKNVKFDGSGANSLEAVGTKDGAKYTDSVDGITVPPYELTYKSHVSNIGWQDKVFAGATSGTTGRGLPVEAFSISLGEAGNAVMVQGHVQDLGWQGWSNGYCGTTGKSKRLEAIRMRLSGQMANDYDIWYKVHVSDYGWLDWAKNGAPAGSVGESKAIEAVVVVLTKKGESPAGATTRPFIGHEDVIGYQAHVSSIGWMTDVADGATAGTTGRGLPMESLRASLTSDPDSIEMNAHVANIGWQGWQDAECGTTGAGLQMEAIQLRLKGTYADSYDIWYRVHSATLGWLGWAKNGEKAGSEGFGYGMQAIEIRLLKKGSPAPGSTKNAFKSPLVAYSAHVATIGWQSNVLDGVIAGTTGRSLAVEALRVSLGSDVVSGDVQVSGHVQNLGWQNYSSGFAGTTGKGLRLEAVRLKLTGQAAEKYDIWYRVHSSDYGWLGWAKNGGKAGTEGLGKAVEAVQILLQDKGSSAPGSTSSSFIKK